MVAVSKYLFDAMLCDFWTCRAAPALCCKKEASVEFVSRITIGIAYIVGL